MTNPSFEQPVSLNPDNADTVSRSDRLRVWGAVIVAAALVALAYDLAGYPLLDPDEGRNAEVAREMAAAGDFALPTLNELPYVDKPALYFTATAGVIKLLGPTVFAARLPSLLFTLATLAVVAWFGYRLFGRDGAFIATIATAATPFTLAYARTVIFDSALTFFVIVALVAFYNAIELARSRPDGAAWWTAVAWIAMAFGVLTKGPVALAIPLLIAVPFAIWQRAFRTLIDGLAILVFVTIVTPWVVMMQRQVPDYLQYVVWTETVGRLFTDELNRDGPIWYFLLILPAAAFPWTIAAATDLRRVWKTRNAHGLIDRRVGFLLLWVVVPLLFFSLAHSKRPQYILPLVPAVGLMVAASWTAFPRRPTGARAGAAALMLFAVFLLAGQRFIPALVNAKPDIANAIPRTATLLGIACAASAIVSWLFRRERRVLLATFSFPVLLIPFVSQSLMDSIGRERSALDIARALEPHLTASTQVVGVGAYPLSLPFYLRRTLVVSTRDGREFTSNYIVRHLDDLAGGTTTLQPDDWWPEAMVNCDRPRIFVFRSENHDARRFAGEQLNLLVDTGKYAAYGPCGVTDLASAGR